METTITCIFRKLCRYNQNLSWYGLLLKYLNNNDTFHICTLLHGPLKLKLLLSPNCCMIHSFIHSLLHSFIHISFTYIASKSLKLSFTLNCVLKRANDLKTTWNWLVLHSTCFRNLKSFLTNGNRSRTFQTGNIDIIHIFLITSFSLSVLWVTDPRFFPYDLWPSALRAWAINRRGKKTSRSVTYGTDLKPS